MSTSNNTAAIVAAPTSTTHNRQVDIDLFGLLRERRGWSDEFLAKINDPSHQPLLDMDKLVAELHAIRTNNKLLVVLPDFDMDGITSGTIALAGFSELGFNVAMSPTLPEHGHGISEKDIKRVLATWPDVYAIITTDTGIDSFGGIAAAKKAGLKVLVTDHHEEIEREFTPTHRADVVVDPCRIDDTYPHKSICGAHVIYQVIEAYAHAHDPARLGDVHMLKLFAGIGTVSDVMELTYENRNMVRDAISLTRLLHCQVDPGDTDHDGNQLAPDIAQSSLIQLLRSSNHHPNYLSAFEGVAQTMAELSARGKLRSITDINEKFYGFTLAPAFNAIRRVEGDILDGFGCFFGDAAQRKTCINRVLEMNEQRKLMVEKYMATITESYQPLAPYVYFTAAPTGMLGLLANQLMSASGLPTAVLYDHGMADQGYGGSCRAPGWYRFNSALNAAGFHAAGHEQAFGVRAHNLDHVKEMAAFLDANVPLTLQAMQDAGVALNDDPDLRFGDTDDCDDLGADTAALLSLAEQISRLAPFGRSFAEPDIEVVVDLAKCHVSTMGTQAQHLRVTTPEGLKCVWWNAADVLTEVCGTDDYSDKPMRRRRDDRKEGLLRLRGTIEVNHFRGNTSANLIVRTMA